MRRPAQLMTVFVLLTWGSCLEPRDRRPGALTPDAYFRDAAVPDSPGPDLPAVVDLPQPDLSPHKIRIKSCEQVGESCAKDSDCGGGICLEVTAKLKICSCICLLDTSRLPGTNVYFCPGRPKDVCSPTAGGGGNHSYCYARCSPRLGANDCPKGVACHPESGYLAGIYKAAVCLKPACTSGSDCPFTTGAACDTKSKACPTGQTCKARGPSTTAGECTAPGKCDLSSGLCGRRPKSTASAKVGDPCKSDLQCADNMTCLAGNSSGYCTIKGCLFAKTLTMAACDSGSLCNKMYAGGRCQLKCALTKAATCRGHTSDQLGDYECRAWNNLSSSGTPLVSGPTCDLGQAMPCDLLKSSSMPCSSVGLPGNPTNMACRDLKNKKLTDPYDPAGLCLDDTASGKVGP